MKLHTLILNSVLILAFFGLEPGVAGPGHTPPEPNYTPYTHVASGHNEPFKEIPWLINDDALYQIYKLEVSDKRTNPSTSDYFSVDTSNKSYGTWEYSGRELDFIAKDGTQIAGTPNQDFTLYFSTKAGSGKSKHQSLGGYNLYVMNTDWDITKAVAWSSLEQTLLALSGLDRGKDLSHITFWAGTSATSVSPTPEPGTMLLLGIGLLGLAGLSRKRFKS